MRAARRRISVRLLYGNLRSQQQKCSLTQQATVTAISWDR
jgi:hypothetical protein